MVNADEYNSIRYRQLRAPGEHGQTLEVPGPDRIESTWLANQAINPADFDFRFCELGQLQSHARSELVTAAVKYSASYLSSAPVVKPDAPVVMSGHQPKLFHPGVWFKNYFLSQLANRFGATAVNLVVDNDLCGVSSIAVPKFDGDSAQLAMVPMDSGGDNIPFEARRIANLNQFCSFGTRLADEVRPIVADPIIHRLWPLAGQLEHESRLGHRIAAARHQLEQQVGLQTLEIPISQMAGLDSFARFVAEILLRIGDFTKTYNRLLENYRTLHRIRSRTHPVPPLETDGEYSEAPFWIWTVGNPVRRRMFVRLSGDQILMTDRDKVTVNLERHRFAEAFTDLQNREICVRPRALMTTLFSRLVLSDLFLHGIGGAKYDQLTDAIARNFFGAPLPAFAIVSATFRLPQVVPKTTESDLSAQKQLSRELRYHPENHLSNPSPQQVKLIEQKTSWIRQELPKGHRRERHFAITEINSQLSQALEDRRSRLEQQLAGLKQECHNYSILGSREYSFALHKESLIDQLKSIAG